MPTAEEDVFYKLLNFYKQRPGLLIHSAHPPSGKTYLGAEIPLPKWDADGNKTRDRNHIDYILQAGPVLIIQELKGSSSQFGNDIEKLREIMRSFGLDGLRRIMARRVHRPDALLDLRYLVPSLGYSEHNMEIPKDFLGLQVQVNGTVIVRAGHLLTSDIVSSLRDYYLKC